MHISQALKALLALTFAAVATVASAHSGPADHTHASAFVAGLLHPLTGLDHLVAMLAVGLWGALAARPQTSQQRCQRMWQAPLTFVLLLVAGALAGFAGFQPPGVEPMIAASLLTLGLLIAISRGMAVVSMVTLIGLFAFFHGVAHGVELAAGQRAQALAGMVLSTAALHLAGIGLGEAIVRLKAARRTAVQQALGSGVAALGAYALAQAL